MSDNLATLKIVVVIIVGGIVLGKISNFIKTLNFVNDVSGRIDTIKKNTSEEGRLSKEHTDIKAAISNSKVDITAAISDGKRDLSAIKTYVDYQKGRQDLIDRSTLNVQEASNALNQANHSFMLEINRLQAENIALENGLRQENELNQHLNDVITNLENDIKVFEQNEMILKQKIKDLSPKPPKRENRGPSMRM